jgi:hypothetical protein
VFATLTFHAVTVQGIPWQSLHADTTSVTVYGDYEGHEDDPYGVRLTYGFSKDRRPHLKPFLMGLGTTREGIPLLAEVLDGNTSDKQWTLSLMRELKKHLPEDVVREMLSVADSAFVTKTNLEVAAQEGVRCVARLPSTFREADAVREAAWQTNAWEEVGALSPAKDAARYSVFETTRSTDGTTGGSLWRRRASMPARKSSCATRWRRSEKASRRCWPTLGGGGLRAGRTPKKRPGGRSHRSSGRCRSGWRRWGAAVRAPRTAETRGTPGDTDVVPRPGGGRRPAGRGSRRGTPAPLPLRAHLERPKAVRGRPPAGV